jgi:hypothetical protein
MDFVRCNTPVPVPLMANESTYKNDFVSVLEPYSGKAL